MSRRRSLFALVTALVLIADGGRAQNGPKEASTDDLYIDFAVPDLSAFGLLGINQNQVTRPAHISEFAVALLNVAGTDGKVQPGVAMEWNPFRADRSLTEYKNMRRWSTLSMSFATAKDKESTKLGLGLRWVPIDHADPLVDTELNRVAIETVEAAGREADSLLAERNVYLRSARPFFSEIQPDESKAVKFLTMLQPDHVTSEDALKEAVDQELVTQSLTLSVDQQDRLRDLVRTGARLAARVRFTNEEIATTAHKALDKAKKEFKDRTWNALAVNLALGTTFASGDSSWDALESDTLAAFGGAAFPLGRHAQSIAQVGYRHWYHGTEEEKNQEASIGGRVILGNSDYRVSGEAQYTWVDELTADAKPLDSWRSTAGLEFRLTDGTWLELAVGGEFPKDNDGKSSLLTLANVKYSFRKERRFATP